MGFIHLSQICVDMMAVTSQLTDTSYSPLIPRYPVPDPGFLLVRVSQSQLAIAGPVGRAQTCPPGPGQIPQLMPQELVQIYQLGAT